MIFVLFFISTMIAYFSFKQAKLRLLSPTFWASAMFALFSFVYSITFGYMISDISFTTLGAITGFLLVTAMGEYFGNRVCIFVNSTNTQKKVLGENKGEIFISKWKVILVSLVFMIVAVDRFRNLRIVASKYAGGSLSGIMQMMTNARLAFVYSNKNLELSNTFFNQLIYMCEITTYIMIFIFLFNYINYKKKQWYLLLPMIPDLIIRFLSTSRTSFIILVAAIIVSYFCIIIKRQKYRKIHISSKVIIGIMIFAVVFMIYGRVRNDAEAIPVVNYIQMYTCSAIYGLNDLLKRGWDKIPYFGFYTLQNIYDLLGISHDAVKTWGRMVTFSVNGNHANLYTSLADPIRDYGILGTFIIRFMAAVISTKILKKFVNTSHISNSFYIILYFAIVTVYCYLYSAIGDVFADYFLNPGLMIRYFIYAWGLIKFFYKPTVVKEQ